MGLMGFSGIFFVQKSLSGRQLTVATFANMASAMFPAVLLSNLPVANPQANHVRLYHNTFHQELKIQKNFTSAKHSYTITWNHIKKKHKSHLECMQVWNYEELTYQWPHRQKQWHCIQMLHWVSKTGKQFCKPPPENEKN